MPRSRWLLIIVAVAVVGGALVVPGMAGPGRRRPLRPAAPRGTIAARPVAPAHAEEQLGFVGVPVFRRGRPSVRFAVPQAERAAIAPGRTVEVLTPAGARVAARVETVARELEPASLTLVAEARLAPGGPPLHLDPLTIVRVLPPRSGP